MKKTTLLDAANPEWSNMWKNLSEIAINHGDPMCLNEGHCWRYLGSTHSHHQLQHVLHPLTANVEYIEIQRQDIQHHLRAG